MVGADGSDLAIADLRAPERETPVHIRDAVSRAMAAGLTYVRVFM